MTNAIDTTHNVSEVTDDGIKFVVTCSCGWIFKHNNQGNAIFYRAEHIKLYARIGKTERERWIEKVLANPNEHRLLGKGASRDVYRLDHNRVLKIERHMVGNTVRGCENQCNSESARWESASDAIKPFLAAVLEHGDGWSIMERAKGTLGKMCGDASEITRTIRHDLTATTGINDLHHENIGYFGNGVFKILDYAL